MIAPSSLNSRIARRQPQPRHLSDRSATKYAICRPLYGKASLCSRLDFTVKSLKPVGEKTLRPLHTASGYPLAGLSKWLRSLILDYLRQAASSFILYDSASLAKVLSSTECQSGDYFIKIDVRDFSSLERSRR